MNKLKPDRAIGVIKALVEGNSIRSIERMTGIHRDTIMRLGVHAGKACSRLLDQRIRGIQPKHIQCDEIWTFVRVKSRRMNGHHDHVTMGDQFVFVALDADTKLVISHRVGKRDTNNTWYFIEDLRDRVVGRVQITTDGFGAYIPAIEDHFGANVDYAQIVKVYGQAKAAGSDRDWYAPMQVIAAVPTAITGRPHPKRTSTSYVERQNLTMRMQIRRMTRLTNAFSKKLENLKAAVALHFAYYNFCRIHGSLRVTPAMAAGVSTSIWGIEHLLGGENA